MRAKVVRTDWISKVISEHTIANCVREKENLAAGLLSYGSGNRKSTQENIKRSGPFGLEPGREWIIYDVGGARSNVRLAIYFKVYVILIHISLRPAFSDKRGYHISRT